MVPTIAATGAIRWTIGLTSMVSTGASAGDRSVCSMCPPGDRCADVRASAAHRCSQGVHDASGVPRREQPGRDADPPRRPARRGPRRHPTTGRSDTNRRPSEPGPRSSRMRAPVTASTSPMLVTGRVAPPTESAPSATSIVGAVMTQQRGGQDEPAGADQPADGRAERGPVGDGDHADERVGQEPRPPARQEPFAELAGVRHTDSLPCAASRVAGVTSPRDSGAGANRPRGALPTSPPPDAVLPMRSANAPAVGTPIPSHYRWCFGCGSEHPTGLHMQITAGEGLRVSGRLHRVRAPPGRSRAWPTAACSPPRSTRSSARSTGCSPVRR